MKRTKGTEALAKLAAQKGVSTEEIRREIQIAIDGASQIKTQMCRHIGMRC